MSIRQGNVTISGSGIAKAITDANDNSKLLKIWNGTKAQYDAITTKDSNTLYNITDDNGSENNVRNIGQIVASSIPLKDAGLHLLDGSILSGLGTYNKFVAYMAELYNNTETYFQENITKIGSIIDNNGVISGFSTSNYAILPSTFNPSTNSWERVIKFKTGNDVSTSQILWGNNGDHKGCQLWMNSAKFHLSCSSNNSSWNVVNATGSYTILTNTTYYAKIKYTGSAYILEYSTDGENYTSDISVSSSTAITSTNIVLGTHTVGVPFLGEIDLNESYININGERWWTGREELEPIFCTEEQWQRSVTAYGTCGKFVYNPVNNTVRLPKVTGFIEGTLNEINLGDLTEAGLPNIDDTFYCYDNLGILVSTTGLFKNTTVSSHTRGVHYSETSTTNGVNFDASLSNSIYGNSSTVQPQSIKVLYYIVIASSISNTLNIDVADLSDEINGLQEELNENTLKMNQMINCITEIPQDIHLEINSNGNLVLKAGSVVYIPNGFESDGTTPNFKRVVIENDIPQGNGHSGQDMYWYRNLNTSRYVLGLPNNSNCFHSGPTAPTANTYMYWYDTTSNLIKYSSDSGSTWAVQDLSFPICLATSSSSKSPYGITSIDQVFNGFGYIANTAFSLPGIKGLGTIGKNDDGTYKIKKWSLDKVYTETLSTDANGIFWQGFDILSNNDVAYFGSYANRKIISKTKPNIVNVGWLNSLTGEQHYINDSGVVETTKYMGIQFAIKSVTSGKINWFNTIQDTYKPLNYWDSPYIAGFGMPSGKSLDLSLGASGATYIAPANGYIDVAKATNGANQHIFISQVPNRTSVQCWCPVSGQYCQAFIPVYKGDTFTVAYSAGGALAHFKFIYALGEV